jgi:hypothetical protein
MVLFLLPASAVQAYPWMIRHGYTNCSACHVDPSGWGLLTPYGRAQEQLQIPMLYGKSPDEVQPAEGLLFGVIPLPAWLNLGLSVRLALLSTTTSQGTDWRDIDMISDIRAGVDVGPFFASVSLGYLPTGGNLAALTDNPTGGNLVSREHYAGLQFLDRRLFVMGGRMNLPFGLRNVEHNSYVRSSTRTDTNTSQQYGPQIAYDGPGIRTAVMGILGNVLLRQAEYREYGYSGYVEGAFNDRFTLGASSLVTHADLALKSIGLNSILDPFANKPNAWRQAHGLFSRWHVGGPVVVLAEADLLIQSAQGVPRDWGATGFLQGDIEPWQGLHFIVTGEALRQFGYNNYGAWFSVSWFAYTYVELRIDTAYNATGTPGGFQSSLSVLGQIHLSM